MWIHEWCTPADTLTIVDVDLPLEIGMDALDVFDLEVALPERGGIDAIAEKRPVADALADPPHCLDRKAQAVLVRPAPAVAAMVVERREELPGQVAVGDVKLDAVEARGDGAPSRILVALQDVFDLVFLELLWCRPAGNFPGRQLARREHVGVVFVRMARRIGLEKRRRRAQPEVQQLHSKRTAVPLDRPRHVGQALELRVVPEPGKPERRVDRILVDQVAAEDDHAETGPGALLVIGHGLLGEDPFVRATHPRRADRREHDPVRDRRVPDAQWGEQVIIGPAGGHTHSFVALSAYQNCAGSAGRGGAEAEQEPRNSGMARAIRY